MANSVNSYKFSKVFVVALPERSDKRDAFAIAASLSGFKFDWIDGVKGELVPEKAVPEVCGESAV